VKLGRLIKGGCPRNSMMKILTGPRESGTNRRMKKLYNEGILHRGAAARAVVGVEEMRNVQQTKPKRRDHLEA
jgi:hypothetical protein